MIASSDASVVEDFFQELTEYKRDSYALSKVANDLSYATMDHQTVMGQGTVPISKGTSTEASQERIGPRAPKQCNLLQQLTPASPSPKNQQQAKYKSSNNSLNKQPIKRQSKSLSVLMIKCPQNCLLF